MLETLTRKSRLCCLGLAWTRLMLQEDWVRGRHDRRDCDR
jgi:hypothetical protein